MPSFSQVYALLKRRKTERNDPRWKLAASAVIDKLPLTGQPASFANPATTRQFCVMARHRYRPNVAPFRVSAAYADATRAQQVKYALKRKEEAKAFPVYVYRVERI